MPASPEDMDVTRTPCATLEREPSSHASALQASPGMGASVMVPSQTIFTLWVIMFCINNIMAFYGLKAGCVFGV